METLSKLTKIVSKSQKRVGRGIGSGVGGHTTGRGAKGDNVRGSTSLTFDGTKIKKSWLKRLPFLRGKHRVLPLTPSLVLTLSDLNRLFKDNDSVTPQILAKKLKLTQRFCHHTKVILKGKLEKKLKITGLFITKSAQVQIIASGGSIE